MSDDVKDPGTDTQENTNSQIDLEKGVVTLKKGDESKTINLRNLDEVQSLVKQAQRGWYFDSEASVELGQLRKVIKNWDNAIDAARNSEDAKQELVQKIEIAIGRPLTAKEERQVDQGEKPKILIDEEENDRIVSYLDSLKSEIAQLKKAQAEQLKAMEDREMARIQGELSQEADRLEKKYDGKDGSPKFDRQKVFEFAADKNIEDLDLAFRMLNFESLTQYQKNKAVNDYKAEQQKRTSYGYVEKGDQPVKLENKAASQKRGSYHKIGQDAVKAAKSEGLSLFTDND